MIFAVAFADRAWQASAQNGDAASQKQIKADRELAATLRRITNTSTEGLRERKLPRGGTGIDLEDRFQNVVLARMEEDGEPFAGCVTSLAEANAFFGRDLETGAPVVSNQYRRDYSTAALAAQHGMSEQEFLFYQKLIEDATARRAASPNAATITIVNNDAAGEGFNDQTAATPEGGNQGMTIGEQRLNLFNFAAGIWGAYLDSSVTINVRSQFDPLTCSANSAVLGAAGAVTFYRDFQNAPVAGTWYPVSLANKLAGTDLNSTNPEINATFNSSINNNPNCLNSRRFYLGFDNSTPAGTTNLLITLLHEMGHGLGFLTIVNGSTGALAAGGDGVGYPDIFARFLFDRSTNKYWTQMTNDERKASAINTNNLLWDGANVNIASGFLTSGREAGTGRVLMFTPNPIQTGSSVSHWSTAATPNLLMEPSISVGLPLTLDLTRQQMRDIGWYRDTTADLVPDTITNVQPSGSNLTVGSTVNITWTNTGGFNRNVTIDLSTDGGATFPITIASNVANTGSYSFTVPNTATSQGRIRVREHDFVQPAGVSAANITISTGGGNCTYSINPTAASVAAAGGNGSVAVTTQADCAWTATSNAAWITVTSGSSGNGSGTVGYSVQANTGAARSGTITIAGQTFTVNQAAGNTTNPCDARTPIGFGQTINGSLTTSDCPFGDGSYIDYYSFSGTQGQQIAISMNASFNAYLFLYNSNGQSIASDDNGGGGTNARIPAGGGFFTLPATGVYFIGANSFNANETGAYSLSLTQNGGTNSTGLQYYSLPYPIRLLDTRQGQPACYTFNGAIPGDSTLRQPTQVTCGGLTIPATAQAVVGTATALDTPSPGHLRIFPAGAQRPTVSNVNFAPGRAVSNSFAVRLGDAGAFDIYAASQANVIIDITGYYAAPQAGGSGQGGLYYHQLPNPIRILETRPGFAAFQTPNAPLAANSTRLQQARVTYNGITIPSSAIAVTGNATVVNETAAGATGQIALYPGNISPRPVTTNINYVRGQTIPNAFTVGLDASGQFNIHTSGETHFIVDITGYYSTEPTSQYGQGLLFTLLPTPFRLLETRPGEPGCDAPGALLAGGSTRLQSVTNRQCFGQTVPASARAVYGNATVVNDFAGAGFGHIRMFPGDAPLPNASNLNYVAGDTVPNSFIVGLGNNGAINLYTTTNTHLIVDVSGYFAP